MEKDDVFEKRLKMLKEKVYKKESDLVKDIEKYLKTIDKLFFWKEHGGMYGTAGIPDIICCYYGKFYGLEAKIKDNEPTAIQTSVMKRINKAGGVSCVVRSVKDVDEILNRRFEMPWT